MLGRFAVPAVAGVLVAAGAAAGCSHALQVGGGGPRGSSSSPARSGGSGGGSNQAEMPDVKGLTPAKAEQAVMAAGFPSVRFKKISRNEAPNCDPEVVCESSPPAGTMAYLKLPKVLYVVGDVCYHPALDDPQERFECEGASDDGDGDGGGDDGGGGDDEY